MIEDNTLSDKEAFIDNYLLNNPAATPQTSERAYVSAKNLGLESMSLNPFPYFSDNTSSGQELSYPFGINYRPGARPGDAVISSDVDEEEE